MVSRRYGLKVEMSKTVDGWINEGEMPIDVYLKSLGVSLDDAVGDDSGWGPLTEEAELRQAEAKAREAAKSSYKKKKSVPVRGRGDLGDLPADLPSEVAPAAKPGEWAEETDQEVLDREVEERKATSGLSDFDELL